MLFFREWGPMPIQAGEQDLIAFGFPLAKREEWFLIVNPEWQGRTRDLLAVYVTCQESQIGKHPIEFGKALEHVRTCSWCRGYLGK